MGKMPAHARVTAVLVVVLGGTVGGATRLPSEANAAGPERPSADPVQAVPAEDAPAARAFSDEDLRSLALATSLGSGRAVPDVSAETPRTAARRLLGAGSSFLADAGE